MAEKEFAPASPYLVRELTAEAQARRKLGRADEAARLEQRTQSIQAAQSNPTDRGTPREEMERQTVDVERFRAKYGQLIPSFLIPRFDFVFD